MGKFKETESIMEVPRGWVFWGVKSCCLTRTELQFGMMKKF